jgi:anti-sigma-K factor RskA
MNHEDWLAQAEIYALGALDGGEQSTFETHLAAGCPECEEHIRQTHEALTLLPRSLELAPYPPGVKERVLARIAAEEALSLSGTSLPGRRWWMMAAGVLAAAGLLIGLSYSLYQTRQELQQERGAVSILRAELQQRQVALQRATEMVATLQAELANRDERLEAAGHELERVERAVATLQDELQERQVTLRQLSAPQARLVRLAGLSPSPGANAQLLWNPSTRTGVLLTAGLPQVPPDRVYELWAIAGKEPVPAGIFGVDEAGHAFLRLPPLPRTKRFDRFAVTLEPAGGVSQPTGPMHLLGRL